MVAEGALEDPKVEAVIGSHMGGPTPGHINIKAGPAMVASAWLDIAVRRPGEEASIHVQCVGQDTNPLCTAGRIIAAMGQMQTEFRQKPHESLIGLGFVHGGIARNTTEGVLIQGIVRTPSNAKREELKELLPPRILATAGATACEAETTFSDGYPALHDDPDLCAQFLRRAAKALPPEAIHAKTERLLAYGAESFAFFAQKVPGLYGSSGNCVLAVAPAASRLPSRSRALPR